MKRQLLLFFATLCLFTTYSFAAPSTGTGLEINNPELLQLVYTIEPDEIEQAPLQALVVETLADTDIKLGERPDAQLFLRIEEHAGSYILYLDFSRLMYYRVGDQCFSKDGYVWGRYAKNINDLEQLHEDVSFFFEEFIQKYQSANHLAR
jgi:hypothetical protein